MLNVPCGRLWHQLTNKLFEFFDYPLTRPYRVDVFNKFVRDFESKLNQLRVVEMGVKVSKEIDSEYSSALGCTLCSWMGTLVCGIVAGAPTVSVKRELLSHRQSGASSWCSKHIM